MKPKPTTLRDIAERAGVSRMTVSCALRHSPRVKPETAERILRIARELHYSPDPHLAMTMATVGSTKNKAPLPLAWINASRDQHAYRDIKYLAPYMEGAQKRSAELGYRIDEFWLREPGMTESRLSSILMHRGIRGVVIGISQPTRLRLKLDWRQFACITIESAFLSPQVHRVTSDYHSNILLALKMLRRQGHRRIGILLHAPEDRRSLHMYVSAFHYFQTGIPPEDRTLPLIFNPFDPVQLKSWLETSRPDAIVGQHSELLNWLAGAGYRVPDDISVAHLALDDDCADWAGIWQHKRRIGDQAITQLVSMILNHETGLPDVPYGTFVPGSWRYGKTLRKRNTRATRSAGAAS